jgi:hypothetical protein
LLLHYFVLLHPLNQSSEALQAPSPGNKFKVFELVPRIIVKVKMKTEFGDDCLPGVKEFAIDQMLPVLFLAPKRQLISARGNTSGSCVHTMQTFAPEGQVNFCAGLNCPCRARLNRIFKLPQGVAVGLN